MSTARRTHGFRESVIRGMSRLAREHRAINLAQGFPNFAAPDLLKEAAARAIRDDINQYAITWGAQRLREALARKYERWYGLVADPEREITVTCGATEAMISTLLAVVDPGDEVIVFEPFYENYGPDAILADAQPVVRAAASPAARSTSSGSPPRSLRARARSSSTRRATRRAGSSPGPSSSAIAGLCVRHDALAVTDEIYEHIRFDGEHIPIATLPGMRERTVTISGASKTFSVTGWRIGWIVAPADSPTRSGRCTISSPSARRPRSRRRSPPRSTSCRRPSTRPRRRCTGGKRDLLHSALLEAGFRCRPPEGAYYILADFTGLGPAAAGGPLDDTAFAVWLSREVGVTPVPGSSFYRDGGGGRSLVRFVFCKTEEILAEAARRLRRLHGTASGADLPARSAAPAVESGLQR